MNGETAELCALTAFARIALKSGAEPKYSMNKYVSSEKFIFLPQSNTEIVEDSAEKWFGRLKKSGLSDVFMLLPGRGRIMNAFSNAGGGCIVCFFDSGRVSYFTSRWRFVNQKKSWDIEFFESEWSDPPGSKPIFDDNTEKFKAALIDIAQFADKIDQGSWANIFRWAEEILEGGCDCDPGYEDRFPNFRDIPEKNIRMYCAAARADVFGGMGSWNDSPLWYAEEKGLTDEYNRLSDSLFSQIQRALLFAVNRI